MPRTKGPRKKGMLKGLKISEVSSVGGGANQGARVSFLKMEDAPEEIAKEMFNDILGRMKVSDEMRKLVHEAYKMGDAFASSFDSIIRNEEYQDKKAAIRENLNQFVTAVTGLVDGTDVIKELKEVSQVRQSWKFSGTDINKGEVPASLKHSKEEIQMEKNLEFYKTLAKMNDDEKAFYEGLEKSEQEEIFKAATDEDKLKMLREKKKAADEAKAKMKKDDEVIKTAAGVEIRKSEVGEAVFGELKKTRQEAEDAKTIAKVERDTRIEKELQDESMELWSNLPGDKVTKGRMLKNIRENFPEDQQQAQIDMMKAGDVAVSKSLETIGEDGDPVLKAGEDKLDALALTFSKADPSLTKEQAYTKALRSPAGAEIYEQMTP